MKPRKCVTFDWALKRLLRSKANFDILEGFLSELLEEDMKIQEILESESNKETTEDKFNKVDLLVKNSKGELIIIEVQYESQVDYLHRMLYGTSKLISEHMKKSLEYDNVKKVISINLLYFDLGNGEDYVYIGKTKFVGKHKRDELGLNERQKELYGKEQIENIYPEYYIIKINKFDDIAKDSLDEWIYFLKNGEVKKEFKARGLEKANEEMSVMKLDEEERKNYERHIEQKRYENSMITSKYKEGKLEGRQEGREEGMAKGRQEGRQEGREEERKKTIKKMLKSGMQPQEIAEILGVAEEKIRAAVGDVR